MLQTTAPRYPVDLSLFDETTHTPSLSSLERSMGRGDARIRDYCIPVNSYFPTTEMTEIWERQFTRAVKYYPSSNEQIAATVAKCFDWDPETVVMFNGATELLSWINQLFLCGKIIVPIPTFGRWTDVPALTGKQIVHYQRQFADGFQIDSDDLVQFVRDCNAQCLVLCNPNNPTGAYVERAEIVAVLDRLQDLTLIVIDESFIDFSDREKSASVAAEAACRENVIVMKSLGKNLGLHGIRVGCSVSNPTIARLLRRHVPNWNINALAQLVLETLPEYLRQYEQSRHEVIKDRYAFESLLRHVTDVTVFPSQANFAFCEMPARVDGSYLRDFLLTEYGFLVRHCGNKVGSSASYFRIAARPQRESRELVEAIRDGLSRQHAIP